MVEAADTAWIGMAAATLTTAAFVPQVVRVWRTRSAADLSYGMLVVFIVGLVLWLVYGLLLGNVPLIVSNGITFVLSVTILLLKIRYDRRAR